MAGFVHVHICKCFYYYILTFSNMMTTVIVCMLASLKLYMYVTITSLSSAFLHPPVSEMLNVLSEGVIVVLQELHVHVHCLLQCLL